MSDKSKRVTTNLDRDIHEKVVDVLPRKIPMQEFSDRAALRELDEMKKETNKREKI